MDTATGILDDICYRHLEVDDIDSLRNVESKFERSLATLLRSLKTLQSSLHWLEKVVREISVRSDLNVGAEI
jgi:hypothetical protein